MRNKISATKVAPLFLILAALFVASCSQPATNTNTSNTSNANANANANQSQAQPPLPANLADSEYPGFKQAGPDGTISLSFSSPADNSTISGNSVSPTFNLTGYPVYMDAARNKGQHIHVILDNEPYEADYDPTKPFSPANGKFNNLAPGTHTLRAFVSREWHESIKPSAGGTLTGVVFHVGQATVTDVNRNAPLLTYSRPKGEYKWQDHPKGVMLDFYLTNATLGPNEYKVKYTLSKDGKTVKTETLTQWAPVWWPWEQLQEGEYKVVLELLDKANKPVPFMVGSLDYNHTERTFKIGPKDGAPQAGGNMNTNANTANRNSH